MPSPSFRYFSCDIEIKPKPGNKIFISYLEYEKVSWMFSSVKGQASLKDHERFRIKKKNQYKDSNLISKYWLFYTVLAAFSKWITFSFIFHKSTIACCLKAEGNCFSLYWVSWIDDLFTFHSNQTNMRQHVRTEKR